MASRSRPISVGLVVWPLAEDLGDEQIQVMDRHNFDVGTQGFPQWPVKDSNLRSWD